jgi:hypothetical protein
MPLQNPPIDYDAIRSTLVQAVMSACGLDQQHVIMAEPEEPGAPRPSRPYFTLKVTTPGARYGDDSPDNLPGTTLWNYGGQRAMTVSFNSYGTSHEEANGYMALWQASLDTAPTYQALSLGGIAVWKPGAVADLSMLLNTAFEGRAQMDVVFGIASNLVVDLGSIGSANISGQADTGGGNQVPLNVTITGL